jgi:hypothetical protein
MAHMHSRMDMKGRAFRHPFSSENVTVKIADQQAGSGDFIECVAERVDQKERRMSRHQRGEVVANTFVETEPRGHAKARCEIDARLPDGGSIQFISRWA